MSLFSGLGYYRLPPRHWSKTAPRRGGACTHIFFITPILVVPLVFTGDEIVLCLVNFSRLNRLFWSFFLLVFLAGAQQKVRQNGRNHFDSHIITIFSYANAKTLLKTTIANYNNMCLSSRCVIKVCWINVLYKK